MADIMLLVVLCGLMLKVTDVVSQQAVTATESHCGIVLGVLDWDFGNPRAMNLTGCPSINHFPSV